MAKRDYDYVVEMMKAYHPENNQKRRYTINYDAIAEGLCIVAGKERWPVRPKEKEQFRNAYKSYVSERLSKITDPVVTVMFQGTYDPIVRRNRPRKGMSYIEDNLKQVLKSLPRLESGEKYVFPALKIIRDEEGADAFVYPR